MCAGETLPLKAWAFVYELILTPVARTGLAKPVALATGRLLLVTLFLIRVSRCTRMSAVPPAAEHLP